MTDRIEMDSRRESTKYAPSPFKKLSKPSCNIKKWISAAGRIEYAKDRDDISLVRPIANDENYVVGSRRVQMRRNGFLGDRFNNSYPYGLLYNSKAVRDNFVDDKDISKTDIDDSRDDDEGIIPPRETFAGDNREGGRSDFLISSEVRDTSTVLSSKRERFLGRSPSRTLIRRASMTPPRSHDVSTLMYKFKQFSSARVLSPTSTTSPSPEAIYSVRAEFDKRDTDRLKDVVDDSLLYSSQKRNDQETIQDSDCEPYCIFIDDISIDELEEKAQIDEEYLSLTPVKISSPDVVGYACFLLKKALHKLRMYETVRRNSMTTGTFGTTGLLLTPDSICFTANEPGASEHICSIKLQKTPALSCVYNCLKALFFCKNNKFVVMDSNDLDGYPSVILCKSLDNKLNEIIRSGDQMNRLLRPLRIRCFSLWRHEVATSSSKYGVFTKIAEVPVGALFAEDETRQ